MLVPLHAVRMYLHCLHLDNVFENCCFCSWENIRWCDLWCCHACIVAKHLCTLIAAACGIRHTACLHVCSQLRFVVTVWLGACLSWMLLHGNDTLPLFPLCTVLCLFYATLHLTAYVFCASLQLCTRVSFSPVAASCSLATWVTSANLRTWHTWLVLRWMQSQ